MSIKNLTDRVKKAPLDLRPSGKPVRLGRLQKGRREGFGKNVKLYDDDHFNFVPYGDQPEKLAALFEEAYGKEPKEIPDVRIPVSLAGNFDIEDCAWLIASKHTKNGSTFLARSDGENIKQARKPDTGKVKFFRDGEMPHDDYSREDKRGNDCFAYGDKLYPWQQVMHVDLILPDFNRLVYEAGVAGAGVVTLTTHSTYDIAQLIEEYYAIIDAVMSLFASPVRGDAEYMANHLPLRNIPLRLFRSEDPVTTPDWRDDGDPGDRLNSTRSLVHWQLGADFAHSMQQALDQRTQQTLAAVANMPLLQAGQRQSGDVNEQLFAHQPEPQTAIPAEAGGYSGGPDWDEIAEEGEYVNEDNGSGVDEDAVTEAEEVAPDNRLADLQAMFEEMESITWRDIAKAAVDLGLHSTQKEAYAALEKWPMVVKHDATVRPRGGVKTKAAQGALGWLAEQRDSEEEE